MSDFPVPDTHSQSALSLYAPLAALVCLLVGVGVAFVVLSGYASSVALKYGLIGGGAGLVVVAAMIAWKQLRGDTLSAGAEVLFDQMTRNDDRVCLLVTTSGRVQRQNAAAAKLKTSVPTIGGILSGHFERADEVSYRLIGGAETQGSIKLSEAATDGTIWQMEVVKLASEQFMWRIEPDHEGAQTRGAATDAVLDPKAGHYPSHFVDTLPVALATVSQEGRILTLNFAVRELLGPKAEVGVLLEELMEGLGRSISERIRDMFNGRLHVRSEVARAHRDGQEIYLQVTLKRFTSNGEPALVAVIADATELKTLEAQFVQSQKMQAVGQLAGGVAHDFNNLLTAISGHCDLLLMRHNTNDGDFSDLTQIRQNTDRAASLVGQLLAFSRKQTLLPKVIDLTDTMTELSHLLNSLLGEKVDLKIELGPKLLPVRVDDRQLEQVIMNLVVNARDAMPQGGEVTIRARNETFEQDFTRDRAVVPMGDYVRIETVDSGEGIPEGEIKKIWEPFFTTKPQGEGTGLGLSTVYGIIKQTGGFVFVDSIVGQGTTFTILLPAFTEAQVVQPAAVVPAADAAVDLSGSGVVLLVEDELPVRSFAARALDIRGYSVIEAACGEEALEILSDDDLHIDLFVSDVIMPGMDGPTWVKKAREARPKTNVIFVSGYAEDVFRGGEISIPNAAFLPKPFSLNDLTQAVKDQMSETV